jgi:hypothetical protein
MPRISVFTPTVNVREKLPYLQDAYKSLRAQTVDDWEWTLLLDRTEDYDFLRDEVRDSGDLHWDELYLDTPSEGSHPMPYLLNKAFRQARGELLFSFSDDDILHPDTFRVFTEFFDQNPDEDACYVSLGHAYVNGPGSAEGHVAIPASAPRGQGALRNQIDGGQACIRKSLLNKVPGPWWPEDPTWGNLRSVDGGYLEHMASAVTFQPAGDPGIPYVLHRFTPVSTFTKNTGPVG